MRFSITIAAFFLLPLVSFGQLVEQNTEFRTLAQIRYSVNNQLQFELVPATYFVDGGRDHRMELALRYKPSKRFTIEPGLRMVNLQGSTGLLWRYSLSGQFNAPKWNRISSSVRLKYSNFADDQITDKSFLRARGKLSYNVKGIKLNPFVSAEYFMHSDFSAQYKMRYRLGTTYKFNKHNAIALTYNLDYYLTEYKNNHIAMVTYQYKF